MHREGRGHSCTVGGGVTCVPLVVGMGSLVHREGWGWGHLCTIRGGGGVTRAPLGVGGGVTSAPLEVGVGSLVHH